MFQTYDLKRKFVWRERHPPHLLRGRGVHLLYVGDRVVPTSIVPLAADRHAGTAPPSWRLPGCFRSVSRQDRRVRGHVISSAVFLSYWGSRRHQWRATARQQEAFRSGRQSFEYACKAPSGRWGENVRLRRRLGLGGCVGTGWLLAITSPARTLQPACFSRGGGSCPPRSRAALRGRPWWCSANRRSCSSSRFHRSRRARWARKA